MTCLRMSACWRHDLVHLTPTIMPFKMLLRVMHLTFSENTLALINDVWIFNSMVRDQLVRKTALTFTQTNWTRRCMWKTVKDTGWLKTVKSQLNWTKGVFLWASTAVFMLTIYRRDLTLASKCNCVLRQLITFNTIVCFWIVLIFSY